MSGNSRYISLGESRKRALDSIALYESELALVMLAQILQVPFECSKLRF
ncbi:MAG: hypothetical protein HYX53_16275 [Chloroflexi bacterium]|nr:hypothetical protein [Chloroflexota bacterium]